MRRLLVSLAVTVVTAAIVVASAAAQTVPSIPVSTYGDALLTGLGNAATQVLPYAAAVTAFAIGIGMIRRWLGARKATKV